MSGGRVTIPNNVRKTIQNIKEITGNHSEDEIYAMLKECSMDPNETAQKLLLQDPFHEVKRKRDRKKENVIKESTEPRWKHGMQGRGSRGGRGTYRHIPNDAGGGKTALSAKENGIIKKGTEEGANQSIPQGQKSKVVSIESDKKQTSSSKLEKVPLIEASKIPGGTSESGHVAIMAASKTPSPSPGVYLSEKDPILMPSQDSRVPVGTIKREVGSQRTLVDQIQETPLDIKSTASGSEVQGVGKNVSFPISRPSSNYNNRLQQAIGPQKVGPSMEWKPKPTNPVVAQGSSESNKGPTVPVESETPTVSASTNIDSKDAANLDHEVEKKLNISDDQQHVIIPNNLYVPEKLGFCFGSFDASFGFNKTNGPTVTVSDGKTCQEVDKSIIEDHSRTEKALPTSTDGEDVENGRPTSSSSNVPHEGGGDRSSKQEITSSSSSSLATPGHHQYPSVVVHTTSPNMSFGLMPPIIGSPSFETNDSQPRDHLPSFVVQQPFDPASYYAQFYRANANAESDGRMSPFHSTTKYNGGNVPVLSSQSSQEVGNSLMLSSTSPSPTPTAATQTSIAVTQQPVPVFRQPAHLPHYPPNYIPYAPYFSPFYVPPPAIHQFLSNGTFPQQPQGGAMYPPPSKYPLPQYKPGTNSGYGHVSANNNTAANSTSTEDLAGSHFKDSNLYITGQQSEGQGVWIAGPGRDMSGSFYNLPQGGQVAYTTPTQANHAHGHGTFANIYHHPGQPVTTAAVHPLAAGGPGVDMVGPPAASVYQQQPQPTQINWPNNY